MRAPARRGTAIDVERTRGWVERFDGYRVRVDAARIRTWLEQFSAEHWDIVARIMDAVEFIGGGETEAALRRVIRALPGWDRSPKRRKGKWRFVAFGSPGKSGGRMIHAFRVALGLADGEIQELIIHASEILQAGLEPGDSVVFVDDFSGTGGQVLEVWQQSLEELLPEGVTAYLVLVAATARAVAAIASRTGLQPRADLVLNETDNVFSEECRHFNAGEQEILLRYCDQADRRQPRGFGGCGLVIVFAHRCPNNSIPILHARQQRGRIFGLFPRD